MRSLTLIAILCLASTPALACVFDSECTTGSLCLDGVCNRTMSSDTEQDTPTFQRPTKGKTCSYDGDCDTGRCIKGSGPVGICLGR